MTASLAQRQSLSMEYGSLLKKPSNGNGQPHTISSLSPAFHPASPPHRLQTGSQNLELRRPRYLSHSPRIASPSDSSRDPGSGSRRASPSSSVSLGRGLRLLFHHTLHSPCGSSKSTAGGRAGSQSATLHCSGSARRESRYSGQVIQLKRDCTGRSAGISALHLAHRNAVWIFLHILVVFELVEGLGWLRAVGVSRQKGTAARLPSGLLQVCGPSICCSVAVFADICVIASLTS